MVEAWSTAGATSAGMYNFLINGKDNYAADREAVAAALQVTPLIRPAAIANRQFLGRAVAWAADQGVRQFLDAGCCYPVPPLTHEAAGPGTKVAYIDNDPVVVSHARALMAGPGITAQLADLRDVDAVLRECEHDGFDFAEPACVILGLVLQYFPADEAREVVARYTARLAAGSAVIVSTWACDNDGLAENLTTTHPADLYPHGRNDLKAIFGELELVPPGIVPARAWRPPRPAGLEPPAPAYVLCGVGRIWEAGRL